MSETFEEPPGYSVAKGFVKANALNNDLYVEEWIDDPWYPAIKLCHDQISSVVPNYNIAQIKEKFGGLRFYIDLPVEEDIDWYLVPSYIAGNSDPVGALYNYCERFVAYAEAWVDGYEAAKREEVTN